MTELRRLEGEREEVVEPTGICATPFKWVDPLLIPPRQWLFGKHLIRGFVSLTIAAGGAGKTALALAEAAALATGADLFGFGPSAPHRVWYVGLEDPHDEYQRRIAGIALHHGLDISALEANLFLDSGRDQSFVIARDTKRGVEIVEPVVVSLIENIRDNKIAALTVDPFVACHDVPENDNGKIAHIAQAYARVAARANCAVEIVHHNRKPSIGQELTADDARGASALVNAARSVRLLLPMTEREATAAKVEERRRFFRIVYGKANLWLPPEKAIWRKLVTVTLDNGQDGPGDLIGVAASWAYPDAFEGITAKQLLEVQRAIDGKNYRYDIRATEWAGRHIASVLGLDPDDKADQARIKRILDTWITSGALVKISKREDGKNRFIVRVGQWAT